MLLTVRDSYFRLDRSKGIISCPMLSMQRIRSRQVPPPDNWPI
ncbi:MAG: hypothetical protein M0Z75_10210 [Nitrospiraceae bacterium]|nr:hypothetical protein [Nitrospiraceae bacterium]